MYHVSGQSRTGHWLMFRGADKKHLFVHVCVLSASELSDLQQENWSLGTFRIGSETEAGYHGIFQGHLHLRWPCLYCLFYFFHLWVRDIPTNTSPIHWCRGRNGIFPHLYLFYYVLVSNPWNGEMLAISKNMMLPPNNKRCSNFGRIIFLEDTVR